MPGGEELLCWELPGTKGGEKTLKAFYYWVSGSLTGREAGFLGLYWYACWAWPFFLGLCCITLVGWDYFVAYRTFWASRDSLYVIKESIYSASLSLEKTISSFPK